MAFSGKQCKPRRAVRSGPELFPYVYLIISLSSGSIDKDCYNEVIFIRTTGKPEDQWSYKRSPDICILFQHYFFKFKASSILLITDWSSVEIQVKHM